MSQQKVETTFGVVQRCPHNQLRQALSSDSSVCSCCSRPIGFFDDGKLCPVCRLDIRMHNAPPEQIPGDYIEDRGPVHRVFADERETIEAPPGYFKLLLGTTATKNGFVTYTEVDRTPWPCDDGVVVEAEIGAIVCRLPLYTLTAIMEEIWRVSVNGALLTISAPFHLHDHYTRDLRNITPICEDTFGFFCKEWCKKNGVDPYTELCDFAPAGIRFHQEDEWTARADMAKNWARVHYWGVVKKLEVCLKAIK